MAKTYRLRFHELAAKEWRKLNPDIRKQFAKVLERRLENPRVPSAALGGMGDCYKIKLRDIGYRLVYHVDDDVIIVAVIAAGRRDGDVYEKAVANSATTCFNCLVREAGVEPARSPAGS